MLQARLVEGPLVLIKLWRLIYLLDGRRRGLTPRHQTYNVHALLLLVLNGGRFHGVQLCLKLLLDEGSRTTWAWLTRTRFR